eukprot:TRINITY_DN28726_c0_g1_i1.p1 TRINITY_DN28726_c0_g1~~TRINITY_DN28726_c0_g1_i1.p1  ORF type:complete len:215 (+),score=36.36 TRINITY_DN28726_c0_g1_i1:63-707(+)
MTTASSLTREVEAFGKEIFINQLFNEELGGNVWDAALVLCKYFENAEDFPAGFFEGKRVVELGAGTGVVGLVLASQGAKVVITDRAPLVPLMSDNITVNKLESNATAEVLNWGEDVSHLRPPVDIVVFSDIAAGCYSESYDDFLSTLMALTDENTLILMSHEKRDVKDLAFFRKLATQFKYTKLDNSKLDEFWRSDDIGIFRVRKLQSAAAKLA